jgi:hypothetical protein
MSSGKLPKTRNKLDEAEQQLEEMETFAHARAPHARTDHDYEVLERYLSGCIVAARSVSWVLKSENMAVYLRVQPKWDASVEKCDPGLLEATNKLRVTLVKGKERGREAQIERRTKYVAVDEQDRTDRRVGTLAPMGIAEQRTREVGIPSLRLISVGGRTINVDAMDFCRRYLAHLEKLVEAAEAEIR